jgi:hypothetical protein
MKAMINNQNEFNDYNNRHNGHFNDVIITCPIAIWGNESAEPTNNKAHFKFINCELGELLFEFCSQESILLENTTGSLNIIEGASCKHLKVQKGSVASVSFREDGKAGKVEIEASTFNIGMRGRGCDEVHISGESNVTINTLESGFPFKLIMENSGSFKFSSGSAYFD